MKKSLIAIFGLCFFMTSVFANGDSGTALHPITGNDYQDAFFMVHLRCGEDETIKLPIHTSEELDALVAYRYDDVSLEETLIAMLEAYPRVWANRSSFQKLAFALDSCDSPTPIVGI